MAHDPTKVKLGSTTSSAKEISSHASDPASFPAGLAVSLNSSGVLSLAKADGARIGVSIGRSLSDHKKTAVVRDGAGVPILIADELTPVIGAKAYIDDVTGMAQDSEESGVTISDAMFVSGVLTGVKEDGTTARCALIDFPGGL